MRRQGRRGERVTRAMWQTLAFPSKPDEAGNHEGQFHFHTVARHLHGGGLKISHPSKRIPQFRTFAMGGRLP